LEHDDDGETEVLSVRDWYRHNPSRRFISALVIVAALTFMLAAATSEGATGSVVTLTVWNDPLASSSSTVPLSKSFLTLGVKQFEAANPDIKVNLIQEPYAASSQFDTLLRSTELAGTTPDIAQLYVGGQVIQNDQYLVPLNNYLSKSYINSLTGWRFVTAGYTTGGKIYAVPYGAGYYYAVYYNKKLMAKAGVKGPWPTTWAGLLALGKQIKAKGITPFEFGEKEGYQGAWTEDALMSDLVGDNGVLSMFTGKSSLNSATLIKPYTAWHEMFASGITNSDAPSLSYAPAINAFAAGKAAMTITGGFYNGQFQSQLGTSNVGLFPVPGLPGSEYPKAFSGGPNNSYVIFKTSKHVADDIKLIQFLTTLKVQEESINELGQLPNLASFTPSAAFEKQQPLLDQLDTYIKQGYYLAEAFDNIMPGSVCNYWYNTNNGVFSGSLSPSSAAASMQTQMQTYLASHPG
jgi:raffinose/stachyose/melibiose transport system substrate-binding protein